ncbi:MAG: glycerol-3-phosphate 1-O-acyltransferase PlsY [Opitutales bacterium]
MDGVLIAIVSLVGYLIGSISFAVLVARARGVDVFTTGSGNPGATNVRRSLGPALGNTVFVLDALKGAVAAAWPLLLLDGSDNSVLQLAIISLVAAIIGHSYSIFLRFRGGKGVATTMGGLLVVMPWALLIGLVVWLAVFYLSRIVALASVFFALSLPIAAWWVYGGSEDIRFQLGVLLTLLIVLRHRSNFVRLLQGKENRFNGQ